MGFKYYDSKNNLYTSPVDLGDSPSDEEIHNSSNAPKNDNLPIGQPLASSANIIPDQNIERKGFKYQNSKGDYYTSPVDLGDSPSDAEIEKGSPSNPVIPKKSNFTDNAIEYGVPGLVGAGVSALLGPEVGYPAAMGFQGLSQGAAKYLVNALTHKPLTEGVNSAALTGGLAGGLSKAISPIMQKVSEPIGKWASGLGSSEEAKELAEGVLNKSKAIGPKVKDFMEGIFANAVGDGENGLVEEPTEMMEKTAEKIKNMFNKSPTKIFRSNSDIPDLLDLQDETGKLLNKFDKPSMLSKALSSLPSLAGNGAGQTLLRYEGNKLPEYLADKMSEKLTGMKTKIKDSLNPFSN